MKPGQGILSTARCTLLHVLTYIRHFFGHIHFIKIMASTYATARVIHHKLDETTIGIFSCKLYIGMSYESKTSLEPPRGIFYKTQ